MENTFDYSQSIESKGFETLNYDDIKGTDESVKVASWKEFLTPNNSTTSFNYSSVSSMTSPRTLGEFKKHLDFVKQSVEYFKSQVDDVPLSSSIPPIYTPSDSNEFLRKKTHLADRESIRKSACNIFDLAMTGRSEEGLPDKVTPDLLVEVVKKASKDLNVRPTIEHLLKFVQILKDDDAQLTPKTGDQTIADTKLKKSENQIAGLHRKIAECVEQIKVLNEVVAESMHVMKSMNDKRVCDKNEVTRLTEEITRTREENLTFKKMAFEAQKNYEVDKKSKELRSLTVQTEDKGEIALVKENLQLKMQLKQNAETFDKISEKLANAEKNSKLLLEKEKEIEIMKKDKNELLEAVELLVESAQRIMDSSRGSEKFPSLNMILSKNSTSMFKN